MPSAADAQLAKQVRDLVEQGHLAHDDAQLQGPNFQSWFGQADAIIALLGRRGEAFARRLKDVQDVNAYKLRLDDLVVYQWMVDAARGVLYGLAAALDAGLLTSIEDRVGRPDVVVLLHFASDIYSDVLSEAENLVHANHLPCAAILIRTGLESGLRRRARREAMPDVDESKVSVVNDWLWKQSVYHKQSHDAVEGWLAPGNAFAHNLPEKDKYTHRDLAKTLQDVRGFLGSLLV